MPKIIFRYSRLYDSHWRNWLKERSIGNEQKILEKEPILGLIDKVENIWRLIEKEVFEEIEKTSN
ncbi:MAG: hypothetical protein U9O20_02730 [Patescibacteria group bacterium]|nr:hypothetical protein [Patescibacteria group bacterium]